MRRVILLTFSLLFIFLGCNSSSNNSKSANSDKQARLQQVADKYSYDDLKQILYLKESKQGGLLGVQARIFRSYFTKSAVVELTFKNYAIVTSFYDVQVELKFIGTNGKIFSKKQQLIDGIIKPCQDDFVYRIRFNNPLDNVSSVIVEILKYKTKLTDK